MNADNSTITKAEARLVRVPVEPPRGDAIQKFDALELPFVTITDKGGNSGTGFGYTIGTGGTAILELINKELLPKLDGEDSRRLTYIGDKLFKSIHALTPGCISSTALAAIDIALWDLAGKRYEIRRFIFCSAARKIKFQSITRMSAGSIVRLMKWSNLCKETVEKRRFSGVEIKSW